MNVKVKIKEILSFLQQENIEYKFKGNKEEVVSGFSTLFNYQEETMTFISTKYKFEDYQNEFRQKNIRLIIVDPSENDYECFMNIIQIKKPTNAFFLLLEKFFDRDSEEIEVQFINEINNGESYISPKAKIGKNVKIGRGCVIEAGVIIGDYAKIHHNVVIRSGTEIGTNSSIYSGTIIGERGFNPFTMDDGTKSMIKHFGGVKIGNNVHIGVNCSIHKGTIEDTLIHDGVKLNTMVHVAHNCEIGENTVITMPTQICGSVKIGKNCHIAATTIRNQCTVGDGVTLGLGSVVLKDVAGGLTMVGNPAKPLIK